MEKLIQTNFILGFKKNSELKNKVQYFNPLNPGYNGVALSMLTPFDGIKIDKKIKSI